MIRARWLAILCLGIASSWTTAISAQNRGGPGGGWGGVVLLLHPDVQKELKLDAAEVEKSRALVDEMREKQKTMYAGVEGLEAEARLKKLQEIASAHVEEGVKALEKILKPEQFARFVQIDLQQRGAAALTDPKIAGSLKLSPEQSEKLNLVINQSILRLREAPSKSRGDRQGTLDLIQAIRKDTNTKAVEILTVEQKAEWQKMVGEPFELSTAIRPAR